MNRVAEPQILALLSKAMALMCVRNLAVFESIAGLSPDHGARRVGDSKISALDPVSKSTLHRVVSNVEAVAVTAMLKRYATPQLPVRRAPVSDKKQIRVQTTTGAVISKPHLTQPLPLPRKSNGICQ